MENVFSFKGFSKYDREIHINYYQRYPESKDF